MTTSLASMRTLTVGDLEEATPTSPVFDPTSDAHWERLDELRTLRQAYDDQELHLRRYEA